MTRNLKLSHTVDERGQSKNHCHPVEISRVQVSRAFTGCLPNPVFRPAICPILTTSPTRRMLPVGSGAGKRLFWTCIMLTVLFCSGRAPGRSTTPAIPPQIPRARQTLPSSPGRPVPARRRVHRPRDGSCHRDRWQRFVLIQTPTFQRWSRRSDRWTGAGLPHRWQCHCHPAGFARTPAAVRGCGRGGRRRLIVGDEVFHRHGSRASR